MRNVQVLPFWSLNATVFAACIIMLFGPPTVSKGQESSRLRLPDGHEAEQVTSDGGVVEWALPVDWNIDNKHDSGNEHQGVQPATLIQPTPLLDLRLNSLDRPFRPEPLSVRGPRSVPATNPSEPRMRSLELLFPSAKDRVVGGEALSRAATDVGNLLKKSPTVISVGVQAKTPIIHDPRIRGSRVGSLAAAGSYWVPARADLDTIVSKFDSRIIESTLIIPGPYTSMLGPGFSFTEVELVRSPRYRFGFESHGATDIEFKSNGEQFFGQQSFSVGSNDWGARAIYAFREGNDYRAGDETIVPSAYQSQELVMAVGRDFGDDSLEINFLMLDQADVIFPGYVFDIDELKTEGYEATYLHRPKELLELIETEVWYNRTRFSGNAQNLQKRHFFPSLDSFLYEGFTDVESMSTGYRQLFVYGGREVDWVKLSVGHDLRFIEQELNEISSSLPVGPPIFVTNRNSPIPESMQANPGFFVEYEEQVTDSILVSLGGRIDYAASDITDDHEKLAFVGLDRNPAAYSEIVGTDQYERDFLLLSLFGKLQFSPADQHAFCAGIGFAERQPTLTELYAAQPFMLLLQNGLNNVTGDPSLAHEKLLQVDAGYEYRDSTLLAGVRGYHAWIFDYITFENTRTLQLPPNADSQQVSLRYVNTRLATLAGMEAFTELYPEASISPFWNFRFVTGTDHSRHGEFATTNGSAGNPSTKDFSQRRGFFSGIVGGQSEPLPSIPPLENRVGLRFQDNTGNRNWRAELTARIVNGQDRVAASLLETPTPGFTVWDLRFLWRPGRQERVLISTGFENLFDKKYREHLDFRTPTGLSVLQPGFNFYAGARVDY